MAIFLPEEIKNPTQRPFRLQIHKNKIYKSSKEKNAKY